MQHGIIRLLLLLFLLPLHPLTSAQQEEAEEVPLEVIVDSSPCSATCGLGVKTQTLCLLKDGQIAMEEDASRKPDEQVSKECRVRKVRCQEAWLCGLRTMTVTSGEKVEMDCVGDVMKAVGRFSWRVSWRLARGLISSNDYMFARWDAPLLDRVVLDPVREEDAGTYCCDVQDASFRRVKRIYWGIRVLPFGILNLNGSSPGQPGSAGNQENPIEAEMYWTDIVFQVFCFYVTVFMVVTLLPLCWRGARRGVEEVRLHVKDGLTVLLRGESQRAGVQTNHWDSETTSKTEEK